MMEKQAEIDFIRIEKAIAYLRANFKSRPALKEVASHVGMSEFHFQRLFTQWAGVSPLKFMNYLSLDFAKKQLRDGASVFQASLDTGLSGTSRLHSMFVSIEGMTPAEYKNEAADLLIHYGFYETLLGKIIVASTSKGVCEVAFTEKEAEALEELQSHFPRGQFRAARDEKHNLVIAFFNGDIVAGKIPLHLKGTEFQIKIWECLLKIPESRLTSYGAISNYINAPGASRAIGTAIGSNPVAFLIPCHRVIQASGNISGYRWGEEKKALLIAWEAAKDNGE